MLLTKSHFTVFFFFLSCVAIAQQGNLKGNVVFDTKEPVLGAHIILTGNNITKETATDFNGDYSFKNVPFGSYNIQIHSLNANSKNITITHTSATVNHKTVLKFAEYQDLEEVLVKSQTTKQKIEDKGFSVNVIETEEAGIRNIQTNELLKTSVGVNIRQNGGLGSDVQYSLNGLSGSAVRIFIDGIPISIYGSSFSLNSIPPAMIERIEVYKGVVPGYLADDALGGAINIILKQDAKNNLNASISYGSFNTLQTSLNGLYRFDESGFTVKASGFYNYSDNDYKVSGRSVVVTGLGGVQTPITARRFNDAYKSLGGMVQVGFTDVKWADQFFVGLTGSDDYKEVQHGAFMTITPYKDRFLESDALLGSLTYQKKNLFIEGLDVNVHGLYGTRNRVVNDTVAWAYSWAGIRAIDYKGDEYQYTWGSQQEGGPTLATIKRNVASIRSGVSYEMNKQHKVLLNHVYTGIDREDSDVLLSVLENTFIGTRDLHKNIYSLTYEFSAFENKLKANVFGKHYQQKTINIDPDIAEDANGEDQIVDEITESDNKDNGYGFAVSYDILSNLSLLTSAEKAVRLPDETEVFGNDGDNVVANPSIRPETSKNYNLGFRFGTFKIQHHHFSISTNLFVRDITDRIGLPIETSLNIDDETIVYVNQGNAKSKGFDAQLNYTYNNNFGFNFNVSRFDLTTETALGTEIDIPNTPFFTMNGSLRYSFKDLIHKDSQLNLFYTMYFTDEFSYLTAQGSNTVGDEFFLVPQQLSQDFGASYSFPNNNLVVSFDIKNIFDEAVYDNLSVQKPGRAFYLKLNYTINKF
ncbi:TonB-dependent receptor [Formosa algae]|uniref:Outer membrane receptor protein involved in Fe transport n=1 Tax=Formosa algae TaxID=225843 RepID=A0A9X1CAS7_9FLAO|nr:TonB-dependent receptor [Formosa algae]MBP1838490.1 outer membrane receptor protein involved in Fe transport [Formosa algae]MDQ0334625.1 outer membrane receptor protein involved in Fe transport [Formosa algae]OEI79157.1 TonB-dependent receptor [Formosa algae]